MPKYYSDDPFLATITADTIGWIRINFTYDEGTKDSLKTTAGHGNYKYDPAAKSWLFRIQLKDRLCTILEEFGYEIFDETGIKEDKIRQDTKNGSNPWVSVLRMVNPKLQKALYTAAAKVLHPDAGGDTKAMMMLNAAKDEIKGK